MGLRDLPSLDAIQDQIFRLPLDARLLVVGPPGSGKTTTLVKRLGMKLALEYPERGEIAAVERSAVGTEGHPRSWIFFTPTDLLKQYLKEAFAKEQVPASERLMKTWTDYRRDVARNKLGILTTASVWGAVLREHMPILLPDAAQDQAAWFEDFMGWVGRAMWAECTARGELLRTDPRPEINKIGSLLSLMLTGESLDIARDVIGLDEETTDALPLATSVRNEVDQQLERSFSQHLKRDPELLARLLAFLSDLNAADDAGDPEGDELDDEDDERAGRQRLDNRTAYEAYRKAMRAKAMAIARGRTVRKTSVDARVVEWMRDQAPPDAELLVVGERLLVASALRWFANLLPRFVTTVPKMYRRYRRERQAEGRW